MQREVDTVTRLIDITSRIEHLQSSAEWIARETVHSDNSLSQTSTLIAVLANDVQERVYNLVKELEKLISTEMEGYH